MTFIGHGVPFALPGSRRGSQTAHLCPFVLGLIKHPPSGESRRNCMRKMHHNTTKGTDDQCGGRSDNLPIGLANGGRRVFPEDQLAFLPSLSSLFPFHLLFLPPPPPPPPPLFFFLSRSAFPVRITTYILSGQQTNSIRLLPIQRATSDLPLPLPPLGNSHRSLAFCPKAPNSLSQPPKLNELRIKRVNEKSLDECLFLICLQMNDNFSSLLPSSTTAPAAAELAMIQRSTAESVEILIYSLCFLVGGPLNVLSFRKLLISQLSRCSSARIGFSSSSSQQITLLKLNLNIADLITMFIYTLSQIIWMISYQWYSGDLLCRLCKFFHTFGFYLNSFVVACFAIDRFLGTRNLNNPSNAFVAHRRVKRMLAVAWLLAILLSVPQCFIFRVFEPSELPNFRQCTPIWTILGYELDIKLSSMKGEWQAEVTNQRRRELIEQFEEVLKWEKAYNLAHLLFVFWIPSLIIVVSYMSILATLNSLSVVPQSIRLSGPILHSRSSKKHKNNGKGNENVMEDSQFDDKRKSLDNEWTIGKGQLSTVGEKGEKGGEGRTRRSNGSMDRRVGALAAQTIAKARQALILAAYLSFWSPYNLLAIINAFAPKEGSVREISSITLPFLNSLIVVNPIVNPLIYGVFECGKPI